MSFFDAKSHDTLFTLPELYEEAIFRFALSCEDIAFARSHCQSHSRLGFAIQLALIRDLGRTLRAGEVPTEAVNPYAFRHGAKGRHFDRTGGPAIPPE